MGSKKLSSERSSAVERIRQRRERTRLRGGRIVIPGEATSPMDRNPTLEVSADVIASCWAQAQAIRRANSRSVIEAAMLQTLRGRRAHAEV